MPGQALAGWVDQPRAFPHFAGAGLDQALDIPRGIGRPLGERPHLLRHHRKALAGLAGARRLDTGVQREKIGLEGDLVDQADNVGDFLRSEEHTSELQSLMRISYAVFCLKKKKTPKATITPRHTTTPSLSNI